jgi:hypothetical protein
MVKQRVGLGRDVDKRRSRSGEVLDTLARSTLPPHPRRTSRRTDVVASAGATWEVGVFDYRSERFEVGLVDPRSGEVVDIIERPWREGEEPYP